MKETYITIKFKIFLKMIEYVQLYIFKDGEDADNATHPLDMPFLDNLIEMRDKHIRSNKWNI